jgi:hypothetical protein
MMIGETLAVRVGQARATFESQMLIVRDLWCVVPHRTEKLSSSASLRMRALGSRWHCERRRRVSVLSYQHMRSCL